MNKNKKGFTLVELLVVIVILGIITGLSIPLIRNLSGTMEKKKYKTYSDSLLNSAKLYNDSYGEDLFGHNENGCAYVTYEQLENKNLLKDIEVSDVSCNSSSTFVRIIKVGDKYAYSPFLGCGKKKNGKADSLDTTLPIANQENVMRPEYCTGTEENNLEITTEPLKSEAYDKKKKKTKIKITSGTGINNQIKIGAKWGTSKIDFGGDFTSVSFKVPGDQKAKLLNGEIISTKSEDITTIDNATGKYYLILKVEQLQDLYGSKWVNKTKKDNPNPKYISFGPFAVDNHKPSANFTIKSTNENYNALNTNIVINANDDEVGKNLKYCISKVNNNCTPNLKYVDNSIISLKMDGAYDGKERTVYIAVMDLAGNITRISKKYKVASQYVVLLDSNGATKAGSLSTSVIENDTKLGTITNPRKIVSISYVNRVGATTNGGDTSKEYNLNGWYTSKDSGSKVASNATTPLLQANVAGYTNNKGQWTKGDNAQLYAHWNPVTATLPTAIKTGHTCNWTTSGGEVASGGTWKFVSANSRTFTAVCSPNTYKVNLNGNGQTVNGSTSTTVTYNATSLGKITNPKKTVTITYVNNTGASQSGGETSKDYPLDGWYTAVSGGSKVASNATTPALLANVSEYTDGNRKWIKTSGATLYAHWNSMDAQLPTLTKTGYTCKWRTTLTSGGTSTVASGGKWTFTSLTSRTFTAECAANPITVTLNGNGATKAGSASTTVTLGATSFGSITNPKKTVTITYVNNVGATTKGGNTSVDYGLDGWYTTASGGSKVASNSTKPELQADISGYTDKNKKWIKTTATTVYAHWNQVSATLPTVIKDGYTCKWTTDDGKKERASGGSWTFVSAISRTFTAACSPVTYSITYDFNKGTGPKTSNPTSYNIETKSFTLNPPTREDYDFIGWTGSNGSTPQTSVTIAKGSTGDKKYVAHWALHSFKMSVYYWKAGEKHCTKVNGSWPATTNYGNKPYRIYTFKKYDFTCTHTSKGNYTASTPKQPTDEIHKFTGTDNTTAIFYRPNGDGSTACKNGSNTYVYAVCNNEPSGSSNWRGGITKAGYNPDKASVRHEFHGYWFYTFGRDTTIAIKSDSDVDDEADHEFKTFNDGWYHNRGYKDTRSSETDPAKYKKAAQDACKILGPHKVK